MRKLVIVLSTCAAELAAQTLQPGFTDSLVAAIPQPTAIAFLPVDRILVTTQTGTVRLVENGELSATPVLTIPTSSICSNSERGLLGIAVDPGFAQNGFVFLFYTYRLPDRSCTGPAPTAVNRVSRFVMQPGSNRINLATETILLDNIPSTAGNHNAGDLKFDRDGFLLVSTGDGGCYYGAGSACAGANPAARELHTLLGKVLRIDPAGGIPPDNNGHTSGVRCRTGSGNPGEVCLETLASGFRNPFRIAVNPDNGAVMVNDVGQNVWEEIDQLVPGADYGWNVREGFCATGSTTNCSTGETFGSFRNPVYAYRHDGCNSISGGTFIPSNTWNTGWNGYYFADYVCGAIWELVATTARELTRSAGPIVSLEAGPYRNTTAMYYTTYARGGELRRIVGFTPASAASYQRTILAPDSLASLFGAGLTDAAISIRDSAGNVQPASVSYTGETQVNFHVPPGLTNGDATITVALADGSTVTTNATIQTTRPAVFTAGALGKGVAAATLTTRAGSGPTFECFLLGGCQAIPIDVTQGDVYLSLYATGIRGSNTVQVRIKETPLEVQYAGPQSQYPGLDQINVRLPASLAGSGSVDVIVTAGEDAPPVKVTIQ